MNNKRGVFKNKYKYPPRVMGANTAIQNKPINLDKEPAIDEDTPIIAEEQESINEQRKALQGIEAEIEEAEIEEAEIEEAGIEEAETEEDNAIYKETNLDKDSSKAITDENDRGTYWDDPLVTIEKLCSIYEDSKKYKNK